jgi:hypothetical protein
MGPGPLIGRGGNGVGPPCAPGRITPGPPGAPGAGRPAGGAVGAPLPVGRCGNWVGAPGIGRAAGGAKGALPLAGRCGNWVGAPGIGRTGAGVFTPGRTGAPVEVGVAVSGRVGAGGALVAGRTAVGAGVVAGRAGGEVGTAAGAAGGVGGETGATTALLTGAVLAGVSVVRVVRRVAVRGALAVGSLAGSLLAVGGAAGAASAAGPATSTSSGGGGAMASTGSGGGAEAPPLVRERNDGRAVVVRLVVERLLVVLRPVPPFSAGGVVIRCSFRECVSLLPIAGRWRLAERASVDTRNDCALLDELRLGYGSGESAKRRQVFVGERGV